MRSKREAMMKIHLVFVNWVFEGKSEWRLHRQTRETSEAGWVACDSDNSE
jgi:hypothetical protein